MSWRRANAVLAAISFVFLVAMCALWLTAWLDGFIGNTAFIGHVSMLALVLACGGLMTGFIAAWRSDVPTEGDG